jgi:ATP-dependent Lon protease
MLPARNRKDFEDIPESARNDLEFVWLERVDDATAAALSGSHTQGAERAEPMPASAG